MIQLELDIEPSAQLLMSQVAEIDKKIGELCQERKNLRGLAQSLCDHKETITTTTYYEGGYDYHARTETTISCSLCEKVLEETTVTHSWYG